MCFCNGWLEYTAQSTRGLARHLLVPYLHCRSCYHVDDTLLAVMNPRPV